MARYHSNVCHVFCVRHVYCVDGFIVLYDGDMLEPERVGAERFGEAKIATADCGGLHTSTVMEEGALYTWVAGGGGGETSNHRS